jgi:hypothetical protein
LVLIAIDQVGKHAETAGETAKKINARVFNTPSVVAVRIAA